MEYWKVWNAFLRDESDPRVMLPAGVGPSDIERVFNSTAGGSRRTPRAGLVTISRQELSNVLQGVGARPLAASQEQRLFTLTRNITTPGIVAHSPSATTYNLAGYSLRQVLACFVTVQQPLVGAPFTVEPLVEGLGFDLNAEPAHSPSQSRSRSPNPAFSPRMALPPIGTRPDRSPVRTAPAGSGRRRVPSAKSNTSRRTTSSHGSRSSNTQSRNQREVTPRDRGFLGPSEQRREGAKVVFKKGATGKKPTYSSYSKFKKLQKADLKAGRLKLANDMNGWHVPQGNFVRTGDK